MEISAIRCLVSRHGEMLGMYTLDLAFIDGAPHVVFAWEEGEEPVPAFATPIDSRFLERLPPGGEVAYQYRMSVEDPRPLE
ncbi:MAG: hypothetical protein KGL40_13180 [Rhodocyclaceae bacterium]|nr:hypothetical protein [Rhodocyclaceae bacterium]